MNGRSYVTLIFIILILKFNNQVKQLLTHVGTHCRPNVTSLLWHGVSCFLSAKVPMKSRPKKGEYFCEQQGFFV